MCTIHLCFCTMIRLEILQHTAPIHILLHDEKWMCIEGRQAEDHEGIEVGEGAEYFYSLVNMLWTVAPKFVLYSGRQTTERAYFVIDRSILQQLDPRSTFSLSTITNTHA